MQTVELRPLIGVGDIHFGLSRKAVHSLLGAPECSFQKALSTGHPADAWFRSCFQVFYTGVQPVVEYIELSRGSSIRAVCFGVDVFLSPSQLFEQLGARGFVGEEEENGCTLVYRGAQLALWRPSNDVEFATVGVGADGYFD